ncbi:MAG: TolC family protein [Planctomycetia bacterium]|nr:TolC family protein [Planctomycetia bacterium]
MMRQKPPAVCFFRAMRKQHVIAKVMACSLLLVLSGCNIPKLRHPDPLPGLPGDFNGATSENNSAQIGVDEFFNDPVLLELISEGLASNLELKLRNQEVEIAANEILARRGAYLPFITGGGRGGVDRNSRFMPLGAAEDQLTFPGGGRYPDPLPNVLLSADLFWQVDIWRQLRNARDAAIQRYCRAVEARNYFITRLIAETAEKYFELAALDKRLVFLDQNIEIQQRSLEVARFQKNAGRGTELAVQRFLAEVRKSESQRLIVRQSIIEVENRINFLVGRYPQPVQRTAWDLIQLDRNILSVGVPAQLLQNRRDIRAAEHELEASGLDVLVARARFFPRLDLTARVGAEAFNPRYLLDPGAFIAGAAGEMVGPVINKMAIQADYMSANARQLQALYDYQRTILNAFTEVINSMAKVQNYGGSVAIKQEQVTALEKSVSVALELFTLPTGDEFAKVEYVDVLLATRDLLEARTALIETKQQQLAGIIYAYQALGGGCVMSNSGEYGEFLQPTIVDPALPPGDKDEKPPQPEAPEVPKDADKRKAPQGVRVSDMGGRAWTEGKARG